MPADLSKEIAAFERELPRLKASDKSWVVFLDEALQGSFGDFSAAVEFAMSRFPERDFMIRNIHPEKVELPFLLVVA